MKKTNEQIIQAIAALPELWRHEADELADTGLPQAKGGAIVYRATADILELILSKAEVVE